MWIYTWLPGDAVTSSFVALELPSPLRILRDKETNLKADVGDSRNV